MTFLNTVNGVVLAGDID